MCIIVAKAKGVALPTKRTLRECFENNKDGSGLMYVKNNKVVIEKGFMTFQDFYKKIRQLKREFNSDLTDKALVMHFRIGTHGVNDAQTTHPFPISNSFEDLRKTYFETDLGMVHNGIMSSYNYDKVLSDTQTFIRDYVSIFKELNSKFYQNERVMKLITEKANISYNKLCFLDSEENIYYYGNRVVENGVIYSNNSYKVYTYTTPKVTKTPSWSYCWQDYYDYSNYVTPKTTTSTKTNKDYNLDDFINNRIDYELLNVGDYYQISESYGDFVTDKDTLIIDRDHNLYEVVDDDLSLIGTDVDVYDSNWKIRYFTFKGGLI